MRELAQKVEQNKALVLFRYDGKCFALSVY